MKRDFSPEERLLSLIRGDKKQRQPESKQESLNVSESGSTTLAGTGKSIYPKHAYKWIKRACARLCPQGYEGIGTVKFTNQFLFAFLLLLSVFLLADYIIPKPRPMSLTLTGTGALTGTGTLTGTGKIPEFLVPTRVEETEKGADESKEGRPLFDSLPYSYYSEQFGSRELFKPLIKSDEKREDIGKVTLKEVTAHLSLIGVVGGETPEAIIEDKKANKTYFLNQGGHIGEIKIEQILEGKVILSCQGEELELVL